MRIGNLVVILVAVLITASCAKGGPSPEVSNKLDQIHQAFLKRDTDAVLVHLAPEVTTEIKEKIAEATEKLWQTMPEGKFVSRKLGSGEWRSITTTATGTVTRHTYVYQYEFEGAFIALAVGLIERPDGIYLFHFRAAPLDGDQIAKNDFTLQGKPVTNYIFLSLMMIVVAGTLATFVRIIAMRKPLRRSILWAVFVLFGIYPFTLDWTTGAIRPQALYTSTDNMTTIRTPSIGLLSAGFVRRGGFSPWYFQLYIPLGVMLFWLQTMRGRLAMKPLPPKPEDRPDGDGSDPGNGPAEPQS